MRVALCSSRSGEQTPGRERQSLLQDQAARGQREVGSRAEDGQSRGCRRARRGLHSPTCRSSEVGVE